MSQETLLEIEHMSKAFGDNQVLKDISLEVHKGEVVAIIGPSGSGKSTLLRCATLLETMDGGSMKYSGHPVCLAEDEKAGKAKYIEKNELKKMHQYFGLVFQNFNLFPHYSVLKNVVNPALINGVGTKEEIEVNAKALLDQFGLAQKYDAYPCELSGGQQQRVSIARALALKPGILFLDEPTSALDPELTAEVLKLLKELAKEHITMIIVTHELGFAREVSDRILFIEGGNIVEQGTPDELFNSSNQRVRDFIGKLSSH